MPDFARHLPAGAALRPRRDSDRAFLAGLYASTREEELAPVDWPPEQKLAFLHDQFDKQHAHYLLHYPRAQWLVIERDGDPVGRLYVLQASTEIRLMDVALVAPLRGQGWGTAIMRALLEHADESRLPVTLHVEPYNRALHLYERCGFKAVETRGIYLFMQRPVPAAS